MNFSENLSKIKKIESVNLLEPEVINSKRKTSQLKMIIDQQNMNLAKIRMEELKRLKETPQPRMSFAKNTYRKVVENKFVNPDHISPIFTDVQLNYKLNKRYDHVSSNINPKIIPTPLSLLKKDLNHDSVEIDMADTTGEFI